MNCRSLRSEAKRNELNTIIETHQPHIIHLQETHLDKSIPTSEILDPERYETLTHIVIFYWTDVAAFDVNPVFTVVT
jgi:exonuclease III